MLNSYANYLNSQAMHSAISYQLHIRITQPLHIPIGALGYQHFPAGRYIYTGSARRAMQQRILRHLRHDKPLRWHIDYLLRHPACIVTRVCRFEHNECRLNQATQGKIMVPGFGASDCKNGCKAHLLYVAH